VNRRRKEFRRACCHGRDHRETAQGIGFDWTGLSYQERMTTAQGPILYAFSILVIFLCVAALYGSWTSPSSTAEGCRWGVGAGGGDHFAGFPTMSIPDRIRRAGLSRRRHSDHPVHQGQLPPRAELTEATLAAGKYRSARSLTSLAFSRHVALAIAPAPAPATPP